MNFLLLIFGLFLVVLSLIDALWTALWVDGAPAIAVLDDALTLLRFGVEKPYRPTPLMLKSARSTVQTYLKTLASASIYPTPHPPVIPDLSLLRKAGIPVVSDEEFLRSVDNLAHRRKLLLGLVQHNHFRWTK